MRYFRPTSLTDRHAQVDMRVVPMLTLLYLACHIDRANIGTCKTPI